MVHLNAGKQAYTLNQIQYLQRTPSINCCRCSLDHRKQFLIKKFLPENCRNYGPEKMLE